MKPRVRTLASSATQVPQVRPWDTLCARAKKRRPLLGDTWYLDEVFIKIAGPPILPMASR